MGMLAFPKRFLASERVGFYPIAPNLRGVADLASLCARPSG
jgi:hypothetical protein